MQGVLDAICYGERLSTLATPNLRRPSFSLASVSGRSGPRLILIRTMSDGEMLYLGFSGI